MVIPEKIYISTNNEGDNHYSITPTDNPVDKKHESVYINEDAFMKKAEQWFNEHVNIPQEVETDENGEPLADSYIKYAKARLEAAKEMFESFKASYEAEL